MSTSSKHILTVEDNQILSDVMRFNLARAGFQVTVAMNGEQAIQELRNQTFDLVITDYQMPIMNGEELCQAIRYELQIKNLPILMCSAKGLELDIEQLRERYQISQVLYKPFSMREITTIAQKLIDSHNLDLVAS